MTFWHTEWRTAAKEHTCVTCHRTIQKKERYTRGAGMDGSAAWSWSQCAHCKISLANWYDHIVVDEEWGDGDFQIWSTEYPPQTVTELRAMVGYRKQWAYPSGRLMPVPARTNDYPERETWNG